jgi:hypothetical protein
MMERKAALALDELDAYRNMMDDMRGVSCYLYMTSVEDVYDECMIVTGNGP